MSSESLEKYRQRSRGTMHRGSVADNLPQYPKSSKFWVDCRPGITDRVSVGVQCPDIVLPMTTTIHEASSAVGHSSTSSEQSAQQEGAPRPPDPEAVQLSSEQKGVLELVRSGCNVFFTGPAGMLSFFQIIKCLPESRQGPESLCYSERSSHNSEQ